MAALGCPCEACKFLRRNRFTWQRFTKSSVRATSPKLLHLPTADRAEAAVSISYEAQARLQDPIYGCVAHILALQQSSICKPKLPLRRHKQREDSRKEFTKMKILLCTAAMLINYLTGRRCLSLPRVPPRIWEV